MIIVWVTSIVIHLIILDMMVETDGILFPSEDAYLDWSREWITECARILKPNRMMCVWGTQKTDLFFRLKLEVLNQVEGLVGQSAIHWSYNWGGRPRNNFAHKFETAWCYSKGKTFFFDRTNIEVERKMKINHSHR